jgi:hypothetical protein
MIPRVIASRRTAGRARKTASAFERGKNERPFRLYIDDGSLPNDDDLAASIIRGFAGHPLLDVSTTAPTADPHLEVERVDGPYPEDTAQVLTVGSRDNGTGLVRYASQKEELARQYAAPGDDIGELTRRIILADHAELNGADAFVTCSAAMKAMAKAGPYEGANIMTPQEAVALVGLFLRLREDFAYQHYGASSASFGKRGFYGLLARDLLPEGQRWLAVCPRARPMLSSPHRLADTVLLRIERALYARDHIHEHLLRPQRLQGEDDALFYLDAFLYSLAGAFDAIGRVVHAACGMEGTPRRANWRGKESKKRAKSKECEKSKSTWTDELAQKAPLIVSLMASGQPHRDALELVFLLRNWVHGEGLSSVPVIEDPYGLDHVEHHLLLPPEDTRQLVDAMTRLGGLQSWGVRPLDGKLQLMDIGVFVETILPRAVAAMGAIMTLTPVESLRGATASRPKTETASKARREHEGRIKGATPLIKLLSGVQ